MRFSLLIGFILFIVFSVGGISQGNVSVSKSDLVQYNLNYSRFTRSEISMELVRKYLEESSLQFGKVIDSIESPSLMSVLDTKLIFIKEELEVVNSYDISADTDSDNFQIKLILIDHVHTINKDLYDLDEVISSGALGDNEQLLFIEWELFKNALYRLEFYLEEEAL